MKLVLLVFAALLLIATLLPLSRDKAWWVRCWDFPRLQLAFLLLLTLVLLWFFPLGVAAVDWAVRLVLIACLVWQAWWITPYTPFASKEVPTASNAEGAKRLKLLTANVLMRNRNVDKFISLIRRYEPDVFVTLESDFWWQEQLDLLGEHYPFANKCPLDNRYGMHVYSALPISDVETRFLIASDVPSMRMKVTLRDGRQVQMYFLHPAPPSPTENDTSKQRDAELVTVGREVSRLTMPVVVAGDLNDMAWSQTTRHFKRVSGLFDPRRGRGMFNTFHAGYPFLRYPLDHIFHSASFSLVNVQRLAPIGSDHFPMLVELQLDQPAAVYGRHIVPV